jgi:hypothetical protein
MPKNQRRYLKNGEAPIFELIVGASHFDVPEFCLS